MLYNYSNDDMSYMMLVVYRPDQHIMRHHKRSEGDSPT